MKQLRKAHPSLVPPVVPLAMFGLPALQQVQASRSRCLVRSMSPLRSKSVCWRSGSLSSCAISASSSVAIVRTCCLPTFVDGACSAERKIGRYVRREMCKCSGSGWACTRTIERREFAWELQAMSGCPIVKAARVHDLVQEDAHPTSLLFQNQAAWKRQRASIIYVCVCACVLRCWL